MALAVLEYIERFYVACSFNLKGVVFVFILDYSAVACRNTHAQTFKNTLKMKGILLHFLLSGKVNLCLESGFGQVYSLGFLNDSSWHVYLVFT